MLKILFVCTGNICRSPSAEGVFRRALDVRGLDETQVGLDSAGTHGYHVGEAPDARSVRAALNRGIDISMLRARRVKPADYQEFDVIFALDEGHEDWLIRNKPSNSKAKIHLLLDYAGLGRADVPDPYYGDARGFEEVLDLLEDATARILEKRELIS